MIPDLPAIPPGPADTTHPRRALPRLALSAAYREVADFAAGGVPTVSDAYGDPWDYVDHAARLLAHAQDVLTRAVVYAREQGGTWTTIAEALDTTPEQAQERHTRHGGPVGDRPRSTVGALRPVPVQPDAGRHHRP